MKPYWYPYVVCMMLLPDVPACDPLRDGGGTVLTDPEDIERGRPLSSLLRSCSLGGRGGITFWVGGAPGISRGALSVLSRRRSSRCSDEDSVRLVADARTWSKLTRPLLWVVVDAALEDGSALAGAYERENEARRSGVIGWGGWGSGLGASWYLDEPGEAESGCFNELDVSY